MFQIPTGSLKKYAWIMKPSKTSCQHRTPQIVGSNNWYALVVTTKANVPMIDTTNNCQTDSNVMLFQLAPKIIEVLLS